MLTAFRSSWVATTAPGVAPLLGGAVSARRASRAAPRSAVLLAAAPQEARQRASLRVGHDQPRVAGLPAERDRGALGQQRRLGRRR